MWRVLQHSRGAAATPLVLGILGLDVNMYDKSPDSPTAKKMETELKLGKTNLSGWEGVKFMFARQDPYGTSVEVLSCMQLGVAAAVVGFILGGVENTRFTVRDFKDANQTTMYHNTYEAQRSIQDKVSKEFFKGGLRSATKYGSFLFCFSLFSTTISVYRGKTSVTDYVGGGALTGALFTMNRGLAGSISGGLVGSVLGTICGFALCGLLWANGIDLDEVRAWQYAQYENQVKKEHKGYLAERERSDSEEERLAFMIIKPEEREKGRILDKLEEVARNPIPQEITIPQLPPESMFRKEDKK